MSINFSELQALLGAIAQAEITELSLETEEFKLQVKKENSGIALSAPLPVAPTPAVVAPSPVAPPLEIAPTSEPEPAPPSPAEQKWAPITSPMVGTFYRAPAPDEPPFVEVGDAVRKEQVVCIIEAMKLMNEIESEIAGQVMEIAVANGEPVEYGQTLMWVKAG
ncbi:MAG: acetyl-CoA carboxylase biotin carboxyl carrier protein [Cyanobacteria bacterium RI_101]|nr:acetyl-CoA carboxylase biotin carboxyl carrier protein [Cyanobacteria bacterium RI_101]